MIQSSLTDIPRLVQHFLSVASSLEHNNQERVRDLHDSMAEPLQSMPKAVRATSILSHVTDDALGTNDVSDQLQSENHPDFSRAAWNAAMLHLKSNMSFSQAQELSRITTIADVRQEFADAFRQSENAKRKKVQRWSINLGAHFNMASAIPNAALIQIMSRGFNMISEALQEVDEVIAICQREYELYRDFSLDSLENLMRRLYEAVLNFHAKLLKWSGKTSTAQIVSQLASRDPWPGFSHDVDDLRKSSNRVLKEVEYLDRRETRLASTRLKFMAQDQRKILLAVEEQKKIISTLQEQQQILEIVKDQQGVLQNIQDSLKQLRPIDTVDTIEAISGCLEDGTSI